MMVISLCLKLQTFVALIFFRIAYGVPFQDCGSKNVHGVYVEDCSPTAIPCTIKRDSLSFYINFTTNSDIYHVVTSTGTARKWGFRKQIFSKQNVCNDSISCPLHPETEQHYKEHVIIPRWIPRGRASVQWKLSSGSSNILCVEVEVARL